MTILFTQSRRPEMLVGAGARRGAGGYLGAQTGAAGANGVAAWGKFYYHFSDLWTVMATTDSGGALLGVYQPDFWVNYLEVYGVGPDTTGLTGKFFDKDIDLYYFYRRWDDPEGAKFMSLSPFPPSIEHQCVISSVPLKIEEIGLFFA